ncbi:MAG TPA: hypothetical protein GX701_07975 [Clostridiales bacterium]|jgi:vacuolar-type H+-ATPase subunit E/Vma4|nr:hypothetical protein [Clostridiales bacterium]
MMSQQEQLAQFVHQIMEDVNRETSELLTEAEKNRRNALSEAENQLLSEAYRTIQAGAAEIKQEIGRQISALHLDCRKAESARRAQIKHEVLEEVSKKVADFAKSDTYEAALVQQAQKVADYFKEGPITVYLREQDMAFEAILAPLFPNGGVFSAGSHTLGGLIAQGANGRIVLDLSFDGRLAQVHEQFSLFVRLDGEHATKGEM